MYERYPVQYYQYIQKFNAHEFYECHDLLEEIWMEDKANKFLQGMLQLAVGIYHFEYGNIKGARWMFANARKYLLTYGPVMWDLNVDRVINYIDSCLAVMPDVDSIAYLQVYDIPFPYIQLHLNEV